MQVTVSHVTILLYGMDGSVKATMTDVSQLLTLTSIQLIINVLVILATDLSKVHAYLSMSTPITDTPKEEEIMAIGEIMEIMEIIMEIGMMVATGEMLAIGEMAIIMVIMATGVMTKVDSEGKDLAEKVDIVKAGCLQAQWCRQAQTMNTPTRWLQMSLPLNQTTHPHLPLLAMLTSWLMQMETLYPMPLPQDSTMLTIHLIIYLSKS